MLTHVSIYYTSIYENSKKFSPIRPPNSFGGPLGAFLWEEKVKAAYDDNPDKKVNLEPVNEFLLKIRKNNW